MKELSTHIGSKHDNSNSTSAVYDFPGEDNQDTTSDEITTSEAPVLDLTEDTASEAPKNDKRCPLCPFVGSDLNRHIGDSHKKCDSCAYVARDAAALESHIGATHKKCSNCDFVGKDADEMKIHNAVRHNITEEKQLPQPAEEHKCPYCDHMSVTMKLLSGHIGATHDKMGSVNNNDQECPHCDFATHRMDLLASHVRSEHMKTESKSDFIDEGYGDDSIITID